MPDAKQEARVANGTQALVEGAHAASEGNTLDDCPYEGLERRNGGGAVP
jgi:hypothetical protein